METNNNSKRIHPLVAAAAVGVLLVSLVGVAAMTGILPNSNSASSQKEAIAALEKDAADKAAEAQAAEDKAIQARKEADEREAAASKAANQAKRDSDTKVAQAQICHDCGRIESVHAIQTHAKPSGVGVVGGAVVGGLLGNQIGGGSGRTLATVAGAVGGGYAGNEIEKNTRTTTTYEVRVRMEDGKLRTFPSEHKPDWSIGDRVRVVDGSLQSR